MTLAPHIETEKGLLGARKAQVLKRFPHGGVAGLELGDEKLPEDTVKNRPWLASGMTEYRQAFFHGSDAYSVDGIGRRYTWIKLAQPRIEALRQAFIAGDSRMRIAYEKSAQGSLIEISNPPDVTAATRPWLKSVTIAGGSSFFREDDSGKSECRFDLSPDLTCIIGGSMTGKSTFLDGLRVYTKADPPEDDDLKKQVEARGRDNFLAGSPEITLECPGQDSTASARARWPAIFHAQNELQRLAKDPEAVEGILARLMTPTKARAIQEDTANLNLLDGELRRVSDQLAKLYENLADAEQACERSRQAADKLTTFSDAGVEDLHRATRELCRWREFADAIRKLIGDLVRVRESAQTLDLPELDQYLENILRCAGVDERKKKFHECWERIRALFRSMDDELNAEAAATDSIVNVLAAHEHSVREEVNRKLAARGLDGATIKEFQALNRQASLLASYEANLTQVRKKLADAERSFETLLVDRKRLVDRQRSAFDDVIETVRKESDDRISARRIDDGNRKPLENFLRAFARQGITRWWNGLSDEQRPAPAELFETLKAGRLAELSMSVAVRASFRECLSASKQRELRAIRCRDRYLIEFRIDDGDYRPLDDLSGGRRVSVLLSLLLQTNDDRPLVIDQPEDELDNHFLFKTVLPALKRLKGRRQIIVATHNANIVVNGDADLVVQLEATANRGSVACTGAIEEPAVRDAIVRTVDGGDKAFRLRRLKYGF